MDVTVVAATNRNLNRLMEAEEFRQDLFFRLSSHQIKIPPLRERRDDIPALTEHFLDEAGQAMAQQPLKPPVELLSFLRSTTSPAIFVSCVR
ncbi:sigma 54-interacting transcriptional regulator [Candidatus Reidiella endopervernicosa]|uniref:Sigma 54-interacting transcriptional regulator n=1 Tax=Candidatus Reidiella endopervernicosa TaxID=2738883 RepID=A0A6N0HQZ9_9GAMM|nr:sigma 54-interacting transcriptional regulator [Candidatus Reidiella endopervernicosa]